MTRAIDRDNQRILLLLVCIGLVDGTAFAEDRGAQARVHQWRETLSNYPRLAVRFRSERINHVFQTKEERLGAFYRNEAGETAFQLDECLDRPLSAVNDINPTFSRVSHSHDPGLTCVWGDSSIGLGFGKIIETTAGQPVSAKYPDNFGNHSNWFFNSEIRGRQWQIFFSATEVFPFVFCESPEIGWYDAKLHVNAKSSHVCLRLSLPPGTASNRTQSVDALFRTGESLPYAVRRFDPSGTFEFRFFIESIQTGAAAVIPDDAFQLTTDN